MPSPIVIDGLHKQYEDTTAVEDVSLEIKAGETYGFLGPNGAGKTTTINLLLAFSSPTEGTIRVFGMDPQEQEVAVRKRTGTLLEGYGVYPSLTGREHLEHARDVKDISADIDGLLERVGLPDDGDRTAGTYSKGMKQRMAMAMAIMGEPDLLVLDEPTTGLDPNGARMVREVVQELNAKGSTIFFSSHILEHVEAVADRIGIINDGSMIADGPIDELRAKHGFGSTLKVRVTSVPEGLLADIEGVAGVEGVHEGSDQLDIHTKEGHTKLQCLEIIDAAGVLLDFETTSGSLDDVFSEVTGGQR